jgi:hypothetical protein
MVIFISKDVSPNPYPPGGNMQVQSKTKVMLDVFSHYLEDVAHPDSPKFRQCVAFFEAFNSGDDEAQEAMDFALKNSIKVAADRHSRRTRRSR